MKVWAVSLSNMKLSPHILTPSTFLPCGIQSLVGVPGKIQDIPSSALPPQENTGASPKAISGRTSYYQARLAFHFLPQLIPEYCSAHGFGPPHIFLCSSPWLWQARLASGSEYITYRAYNKLCA
jgi:hypothetical protein